MLGGVLLKRVRKSLAEKRGGGREILALERRGPHFFTIFFAPGGFFSPQKGGGLKRGPF